MSGGRGRLLKGVGRGCSLFLFGHPLLRAGRCLFLETLFFGRSGSPGSRSNSRHPAPAPSLHPGLPPWVPAALAFLARLLPARRTWAGSWRGGPAPARKLESFVFAPRPARRGEEGGAEAALGRPRAGRVPALASAPGFFRLSLSGWVCGFPEAIKTGPASLPTGLSASSAPLSRSWACCTPWAHRGTTAGPRAGAVFRASRSLFAAEPQFAIQ